MKTLVPGSTIGIIGGGQLGRMLALAAAPLGYRVHIYDPDPDCCARDVSAAFTQGAFGDRDALARFAAAVDVATYEFENVDADPLQTVATAVPMFPPLAALRVAQDRVAEKRFFAAHGGQPARWADVPDRAAIDDAVGRVGLPAILKTTRFGYDGKGQARLLSAADGDAAWDAIGGGPAILEALVTFEREFSIVLTRGQDGVSVRWTAAENVHRHGILDTSTVPGDASIEDQVDVAGVFARGIADALDYVGTLAIEFFATADGPVVNEMAPRVHNSGHWTIEGAETSQFENHVRAICGLPLGATTLLFPGVRMENLIGDDVDRWPSLVAEPGAHLHLYGKGAPRPGRKMGHVTRIG